MSKKDTKGITAKKENFSEWYPQVIQKAELIEYSPVSGCYIMKPASYAIWEKVQSYFDDLIKKDGVKNVYFPLFIPESFLQKESEHVEGFAPEVAWVTHHGKTKMPEKLAIRPTSETIMYDAYSKWIRSHKDLPLRLNQWCNVVRWEFNNPVPFLRSREFLWQEGHTVFATQKEAEKETYKILDFYSRVFEDLYAVPVFQGRKSEKEKFAGADYTLSVETFLPLGKAIQGATSHHLGRNFSKAFNINFIDEKEKSRPAWQNSWGISTRSIGVMILMHGDDKGLVLPPKVAPVQVVIVPILFEKSKNKILKEAQKIKQTLEKQGLTVHLDDRDDYSPGWKFNEWEVKGIPLRIELGPKDMENKQVVLVRRDNSHKEAVKISILDKKVPLLLDQIQKDLFRRAKKSIKENTVEVSDLTEAKKQINDKKMLFAPWCAARECEENIKDKLDGAKSLNSPFKQPKLKKGQKCFACHKKATAWFYFGKSY